MKRIVSILLTVLLLVSLVPMTVLAGSEITLIFVRADAICTGEGGTIEEGYDVHGDFVHYYRYNIVPSQVIVQFRDKTSVDVTKPQDCIAKFGYMWSIETDQSPDNPWGSGEHTATLRLGSRTTTFKVTISTSPLAYFTVEPVTITECVDGSWAFGIDSYFWYSYAIGKITAHMRNGEVITAYDSLEFNGKTFYPAVYDTQGESHWGIGEQKATVYLMGKTYEMTVNVEKCPITSVNFRDVYLTEGINALDYGGWDHYEYRPDFSITFDDGNTYYPVDGVVTYKGKEYFAYLDDDQYNNAWGVGSHQARAMVGDRLGIFNVIISENPYNELEIYEDSSFDLYAKLYKKAGGYDTWKIDDFIMTGYSGIDRAKVVGFIVVNGKQISANFGYAMDVYLKPVYESGVYLELGGLVSEPITTSSWLKKQVIIKSLCSGIAGYAMHINKDFAGMTTDKFSVDDLVTLAVSTLGLYSFSNGPFNSDGELPLCAFFANDLVHAVKYVFGVDIDINDYSKYDPSDPDNVPVYVITRMSDLLVGGNMIYTHDEFIDEEKFDDGKTNMSVRVKLDADLKIKSISILRKTVFGDATGDGAVDMKDVLSLRLRIGGIEKFTKVQYDRADYTRDGYVDMKDVLGLRLKIAGLE